MQRIRDLVAVLVAAIALRLKRLKKQPIFRDRVFIVFGSLTVFVLVVLIFFLILGLRPQDFYVPTEYSSTSGFDNLAPWYHSYIYGFFAIIVTLINLTLAIICFKKTRISSFFLIFGALFINILTLIIVVNLLNVQQL